MLLILCFVFLVVGSIFIFLSKEIANKVVYINNVKCEKICKVVGFVVTMLALFGIYILKV